jgi:hypothetical protein
MDIVGEAMLGLVGTGAGNLLALLFRVLPNDSDLRFPYLKGSEGIRQTKDCHCLKKD